MIKLFCKHKFKYYGKTVEPIIGGYGVVVYHFICKQCHKEITLKSTYLKDELEKEGLNILKSIAVGNDISSLNENEELILKIYDPSILQSFIGRGVDVVKRRYMSKGIDLNEIPQIEGWV